MRGRAPHFRSGAGRHKVGPRGRALPPGTPGGGPKTRIARRLRSPLPSTRGFAASAPRNSRLRSEQHVSDASTERTGAALFSGPRGICLRPSCCEALPVTGKRRDGRTFPTDPDPFHMVYRPRIAGDKCLAPTSFARRLIYCFLNDLPPSRQAAQCGAVRRSAAERGSVRLHPAACGSVRRERYPGWRAST